MSESRFLKCHKCGIICVQSGVWKADTSNFLILMNASMTRYILANVYIVPQTKQTTTSGLDVANGGCGDRVLLQYSSRGFHILCGEIDEHPYQA